MSNRFNQLAIIFIVTRRVLIAGALLVTASAQRDSDELTHDYCFNADDPQSILIAKQSKESIEIEGAEIFVRSEFRDESGEKAVWIYETRSTHTSKGLELTSDNCLRQTFDEDE
jgi:hypothetical protein